MAHINLAEFHFWDNLVVVAFFIWRVVKHGPKYLALLSIPLLKFIASKTGAFVINDYLNAKYPSRKQRRAATG